MRVQLKRFQRTKKNSIWSRQHSSDILAKNVAAICFCLKSLPEANLKSLGLISLLKGIPEQPSIDSVVWLLLLSQKKICVEKEKGVQGSCKEYNLRRERAPGSGIEINPVFEKIKEKPDIKRNKGSSDFKTRPHPAKLPTCERN